MPEHFNAISYKGKNKPLDTPTVYNYAKNKLKMSLLKKEIKEFQSVQEH